MTGFTGFRLIAAIWRERSRIICISLHVRCGRIGIMTPGTGQPIGIGHPGPARCILGMAGLAVADVHRVCDVPVAAEGSGFLVIHRKGRVVEVRTVVNRMHSI